MNIYKKELLLFLFLFLFLFPVKRREVKYACCPNNYTLLQLTLYLRRKPLFYLVNLIIPTSIITLIAIVGFFTWATLLDHSESFLFQNLLSFWNAWREGLVGYHHTPLHVHSDVDGLWSDAHHLHFHSTDRMVHFGNDNSDITRNRRLLGHHCHSETRKSRRENVKESTQVPFFFALSSQIITFRFAKVLAWFTCTSLPPHVEKEHMMEAFDAPTPNIEVRPIQLASVKDSVRNKWVSGARRATQRGNSGLALISDKSTDPLIHLSPSTHTHGKSILSKPYQFPPDESISPSAPPVPSPSPLPPTPGPADDVVSVASELSSKFLMSRMRQKSQKDNTFAAMQSGFQTRFQKIKVL